jgi:hypothetical protein
MVITNVLLLIAKEHKESRVSRGRKVHRGYKGRLDPKAHRVCKEKQGPKVPPDQQVYKALKGPKERKVHKDRKDQRDLRVLLKYLVAQDLLFLVMRRRRGLCILILTPLDLKDAMVQNGYG